MHSQLALSRRRRAGRTIKGSAPSVSQVNKVERRPSLRRLLTKLLNMLASSQALVSVAVHKGKQDVRGQAPSLRRTIRRGRPLLCRQAIVCQHHRESDRSSSSVSLAQTVGAFAAAVALGTAPVANAADGTAVFAGKCVACHIAGGNVVAQGKV